MDQMVNDLAFIIVALNRLIPNLPTIMLALAIITISVAASVIVNWALQHPRP